MSNHRFTLSIHSGLEQGQVLQRIGSRGAKVSLRGTASGNGPLYATISSGKSALKGWKKRHVGKITQNKFRVVLNAIPVGGPYRLCLEGGGQRLEIAPFFVGDVWILAGQSNMEGAGNMTQPAKPHPLIRAFSMRRAWRLATDPLHVLAESPDVCHAEIQCSPDAGEAARKTAVKGVGVGIFFARDMIKRSAGVPQGLICAAHGGTSMQQWDPTLKDLGGKSLYGSMLTSVCATGQPVAGLLWYQGEAEADPKNALLYTKRMRKLVAASRRDLRQARLPWIMVQLARVFSEPSSFLSWNSIQEQQRLLPTLIKHLEMVAAIDLPLDDQIHIGAAGYPLLAARLASAADRLAYGNKREVSLPRLRSIRPVGVAPVSAVDVEFDFVPGGLRAIGEPMGFKFVSREGKSLDLIYKTELRENTARLHLIAPLFSRAVLYYGFDRAPYCNITDGRGFSLPAFSPKLERPETFTPFVTQWKVSAILPATTKLDQVTLPKIDELTSNLKSYPLNGFINEHETWSSQSGQVFFQSHLHLIEPMKLRFLMGYDGPFRLWLDRKPIFKNMAGTNPCFADESEKTISLNSGVHEIHVGMDLNGGRAWGFFLRFARRDISDDQILAGEITLPTFST